MTVQKRLDEILSQMSDVLHPLRPMTAPEIGAWRSPDGDTLLHVAAMRGNIRVMELLLGIGVNVDEQGEMDSTALHYAAMFRHRDAFDLLVRCGANTKILDSFGNEAGNYEFLSTIGSR